MNENDLVRHTSVRLFILFTSVYLLTASVVNFYHIDAGELHVEVTRSLVEGFDLSVPEGVGMRGADGRYYSWLGIGLALLAVPFYSIGKLAGSPEIAVSVMNQIVGAATVVLIFLFSVRLGYSKRASILVSVLYGLGTIAWPLSKQPFDHVVETFFVLLSVYFMYRYISDRKALFLLSSGASLGVALLTRLTSTLVIPPLFIMVTVSYLKRHDVRTTAKLMIRDILLFSLALLPFMALNLYYNYYRFGSVFETGYSLMGDRMGANFLGNKLMSGLSGLLISPGKGFFFYSPVAILFFFSIKSFLRKHPSLAVTFVLIILSYLLVLSKYIFWHGDWAWGPRYIVVTTPFFMIPVVGLIDSHAWSAKKVLRAALYFIVILSFTVQLAAISVDFNKYFLNLRFLKKANFIALGGDGVQPLFVPPIETYFKWYESPILAQVGFIFDITRHFRDYRYSKPPDSATLNEKFKADPVLNIFDFWWLHMYFVQRSYAGLIVAFILFSVSINYASRLRKLSH